MHLSLLPLALLTTTVLADGASILAAMGIITNSTTALDNVVTSFPSGILGITDVIPLLSASAKLLSDIQSGTQVADNSANLTVAEAIGIAGATQTLSTTVNKTLTDVIAAKSRFDTLLIISPTVLLNLKLEKKASDDFGAAVVEKIPEALQGYVFYFILWLGALRSWVLGSCLENSTLQALRLLDGVRADLEYRIATGLLAPIDDSFDEAIAVYE